MKYKADKYILIVLIMIALIIGYTHNPWGNKRNYTNYNLCQNKENANVKNKALNTGKENIKINYNLNDDFYNSQWAIKITQSDKAWSLIKQKRQIKVGIVDSGIDYKHPDLKNRVDAQLGYDFVNEDRDAMDDDGHGTSVAGIIAAEANNKRGISGIVGKLDIKLIPIKVLDKNGLGSSDIVANGIEYAVTIGCDVINVSIDFKNKDEYIKRALDYAAQKGVLVVAASGNSNNNCNLYSPAGDRQAYTVAAVTKSLKRAYYSSYGSNVSISAPGEDIITTIIGGKYGTKSGTSMSAPIVTGIAAMIKAENPDLKSELIKAVLNDTGTDILSKGKDTFTGYGLVNAYSAVKEVIKLEADKPAKRKTFNFFSNMDYRIIY